MIIINNKENAIAQVSNQNIIHPLKKNNARGAVLIFNFWLQSIITMRPLGRKVTG